MYIKQRVYENIEIEDKQKDLKFELQNGNPLIYFIKSFPFKNKLETKTLSVFSKIAKSGQNDKEKEEKEIKEEDSNSNEEDEVKLDAPKKKHALAFASESDSIFQHDDEEKSEPPLKQSPEEDGNIQNSLEELSIHIYIEFDGFIYSIKEFVFHMSINSFEPLLEVFNVKSSLNEEQFNNLLVGSVDLSIFELEEEKIKGIFKKGEIDLTIRETFMNKNEITLNNVSVLNEYIMLDLERFEGNQSIFYKIQDKENVNHEMIECMQKIISEQVNSTTNIDSFFLQYPKSDI